MESGEEEIWYSKFVYKKVWNLDMDHIEAGRQAGKHASNKKALAKPHSWEHKPIAPHLKKQQLLDIKLKQILWK